MPDKSKYDAKFAYNIHKLHKKSQYLYSTLLIKSDNEH